MSKPFDTILKQLLDNYAADWVQWLGPRLNLPPGPIVAIDPQLATIQPMADKVFRLPDGAGLLHIECQSSWDGELSACGEEFCRFTDEDTVGFKECGEALGLGHILRIVAVDFLTPVGRVRPDEFKTRLG